MKRSDDMNVELNVEAIMSEYDELLANANRQIALLRAENAKLRELLNKKEGE